MAKKSKGNGHGSHEQHAELSSHAPNVPGKDSMAHPSHHAANKEHGMPEGMAPSGGYDDAEDSPMGENEC